MTYAVKEIYYTLQGEGANAGRPAVFLRFSGCNLWSGLEKDRDKGPGGCSRWCDTDFVGTDGTGGGKFKTATELVDQVRAHDHEFVTTITSDRIGVAYGREDDCRHFHQHV